MSLIVGGSFLSLSQGRARAESRAEVNSAIRVVMDRIKDDLKNATYIYVPSVGTNATGMIVVVNTDTITYDRVAADNTVRRQVNTDAAVVITPANVKFTALNFEYFQNVSIPLLKIASSIKVEITAAYNSTDPSRTYTQIKRSTFPLGRLFSIVRPAGSGPGAGGLPLPDSELDQIEPAGDPINPGRVGGPNNIGDEVELIDPQNPIR